MKLIHIATITHSEASSGLNLGKAIRLFVGDVKADSDQDLITELQADKSVHVSCCSDRDVAKAVQSARRMKGYLGTHAISFVEVAQTT